MRVQGIIRLVGVGLLAMLPTIWPRYVLKADGDPCETRNSSETKPATIFLSLSSKRDGELRLLGTFTVVHVSLVAATTALLMVECACLV